MHPADILHAIDDLLDRERDVLLSGNIEGIATLTDDKERLLAGLASQQHGITALHRLHDKARRNAGLHEASLRGIRSAVQRIDVLRKGAAKLDTYDIAGQRQPLRQQHPDKLEKKA